MRIAARVGAWVAAALVGSCATPPPPLPKTSPTCASAAPTLRPLHANAPASASVSPVAAAEPILDFAEIPSRLQRAWDERAKHEDTLATRDFATVARALEAKDGGGKEARRHVGLDGRTRVYLAPSGRFAATETPRGMVVFDRATGEPTDARYSDAIVGWRGAPAAPHLLLGGPPAAIYDPETRRDLVDAEWILWPKGDVAYVHLVGPFEECHWHLWDDAAAKHVGDLEVPTGPERCDDVIAPPFVSADGKWLVGWSGRWKLATRHFQPFPPAWAHEVSADGRFLAYLRTTPTSATLVLRDLATGAEKTASDFGFTELSNTRPLSFSDDGAKLEVVDYTVWTFAVPSMKLLRREPLGPKTSVPLAAAAPSTWTDTTAEADARAELEAHACSVGGLVLPRATCDATD